MGKSQEPLKVTCPCCKAKLSVDAALGVVLSHEEPPRKGLDVDLTNAAGILSEQQRWREDKFADSWFQETNKEDILVFFSSRRRHTRFKCDWSSDVCSSD